MELEKFRRIAGLKQSELARKAGVDLSIVWNIENDPTRGASYETIVRLARALNLSAEELQPVGYCGRCGQKLPSAVEVAP